MTSASLFQAISRGNTSLIKSLVERSICTDCYQQPNQRMLVNRAANALLSCQQPDLHLTNLKNFRSQRSWYHGDKVSFENEIDPDQIHEEAVLFCPQMWPLLMYLPATTIAMYRPEIFSLHQTRELSRSLLPTQNEIEVLKLLRPCRGAVPSRLELWGVRDGHNPFSAVLPALHSVGHASNNDQ